MNTSVAMVPHEEPPAPETPIPGLALARRPPGPPDELARFSLEPTDFDGALRAATAISRSNMFGGISPEAALVRILTGRSLGIPMMVAMVHVYDVEGRPSVSARLKAALCIRHHDCLLLEYVSGDATQATYRIQRRGQEVKTFKFTIEQARAAGLVKDKSGWVKWPHRMLQARAVSEAVDVVFPEAAMGLGTYYEEPANDNSEVVSGAPQIAQRVEVSAPKVTARQWMTESAALKERLAAALMAKDVKAIKAVRKDFAKFHEEAPQDIAEDILAFYNDATKAQPSPRTPAVGDPYVPPEQRGDAYNGPDIPVPFG